MGRIRTNTNFKHAMDAYLKRLARQQYINYRKAVEQAKRRAKAHARAQANARKRQKAKANNNALLRKRNAVASALNGAHRDFTTAAQVADETAKKLENMNLEGSKSLNSDAVERPVKQGQVQQHENTSSLEARAKELAYAELKQFNKLMKEAAALVNEKINSALLMLDKIKLEYQFEESKAEEDKNINRETEFYKIFKTSRISDVDYVIRVLKKVQQRLNNWDSKSVKSYHSVKKMLDDGHDFYGRRDVAETAISKKRTGFNIRKGRLIGIRYLYFWEEYFGSVLYAKQVGKEGKHQREMPTKETFAETLLHEYVHSFTVNIPSQFIVNGRVVHKEVYYERGQWGRSFQNLYNLKTTRIALGTADAYVAIVWSAEDFNGKSKGLGIEAFPPSSQDTELLRQETPKPKTQRFKLENVFKPELKLDPEG